MNLKKLIFTQNACYKAGKTITPLGIMIHSTGANNPSLMLFAKLFDGSFFNLIDAEYLILQGCRQIS